MYVCSIVMMMMMMMMMVVTMMIMLVFDCDGDLHDNGAWGCDGDHGDINEYNSMIILTRERVDTTSDTPETPYQDIPVH